MQNSEQGGIEYRTYPSARSEPDGPKSLSWLDKRIFDKIPLNAETILWVVILLLAIFSRFYILGARVQSHDENSHVYYSWRFYKGEGFAHDPLMHGPLQFHLLALSYFMFGDNDFTARVPAALFSVAAVMFMWFYRRYLGRAGALVGATMVLISPYMSYYGRYARNEAFIEMFGIVMIWAILRYLEAGQPWHLYLLTAVTVLHFTSKETSFIYTAQALVFLGLYFIYQITQARWPNPQYRGRFMIFLLLSVLALGGLGAYFVANRNLDKTAAVVNEVGVAPSPLPGDQTTTLAASGPSLVLVFLLALFAALLVVMMYYLIRGYTLKYLRADRSLSMVIVLFTLVLPQLAAFPVNWVGWKVPTNASEVMALTMADIWHIAVFLVPLALVSIAIGLFWNWREWLINAAIWYGIFILFYTSVFTNGAGFFTGMVGSLGYWLEQQAVQRGSQPWYYYWLVQVPVYEYLPALGTWLAFGMAIFAALIVKPERADEISKPDAEGELAENLTEDRLTPANNLQAATNQEEDLAPEYSGEESWYNIVEMEGLPTAGEEDLAPPAPGVEVAPPVFPLFGFWALTSMLAFTIAGEKMPWLTVHITLPAILCAAWAFGRLIDAADWRLIKERRGWLAILLFPAFLISLFYTLGSLLGPNPPFQGQELGQLQASSTFLLSFIAAVASGAGLVYLVRTWPTQQIIRLTALFFFAILGILTARVSIFANYYNYDYANELLVYAHSAPGVKTALAQIEEISRRTTDGLELRVAYDNDTSYPYWWYLRNYPNAQFFGANPSRALREVPVILVGDGNFGKIEPVVAGKFDRFDYIRLWWPNQDYYNLTWERVRTALSNPAMREALFYIWLDRDYTKYGQVTGKDMSPPNWNPSDRMRLYIRKDITSQLWNYGAAPSTQAEQADPFEKKHITLPAQAIIGKEGGEEGQFRHPRDIAIAPDGSLYVADTENHRIQHLAPNGNVLQVWGSFGDITQGVTEGGRFNQPWGIGLGPDGSVYVADTWNHRVQKFTSDGKFLTQWGYFGQAERPEAFWGPRDVAVDELGRVFVTDTGNKRVVVFDDQGVFITQFGEAGMNPGQLDEPVGLAIDQNGLVYVADTWNQRIQVFQEAEEGQFLPFRTWEVTAWYGQSLDNKPYINVDNKGSLFAADPEGYRVLQFSVTGEAIRSWGDYGVGADAFAMPASVAVAPDGSIWVVDTGNNRLMVFTLPVK